MRHPLLLTLLCVSVLFMRVSGVHMHFCFDGSEAPTTVHMADAGLHDDHGPPEPIQHADLEVQFDNVLAKGLKLGLDLPALLAALALGFLLLQSARIVPGGRSVGAFVPLPLPFLRPPLRGPPL